MGGSAPSGVSDLKGPQSIYWEQSVSINISILLWCFNNLSTLYSVHFQHIKTFSPSLEQNMTTKKLPFSYRGHPKPKCNETKKTYKFTQALPIHHQHTPGSLPIPICSSFLDGAFLKILRWLGTVRIPISHDWSAKKNSLTHDATRAHIGSFTTSHSHSKSSRLWKQHRKWQRDGKNGQKVSRNKSPKDQLSNSRLFRRLDLRRLDHTRWLYLCLGTILWRRWSWFWSGGPQHFARGEASARYIPENRYQVLRWANTSRIELMVIDGNGKLLRNIQTGEWSSLMATILIVGFLFNHNFDPFITTGWWFALLFNYNFDPFITTGWWFPRHQPTRPKES